MAMTAPATVAAQIVGDIGLTGAGGAAATADWTKIITRIQSMLAAATVTVDVSTSDSFPSVSSIIAPSGGGACSGTLSGFGAGTGTRAGGAIT